MADVTLESELSEPVSEWLRAQGCEPFAEVPFPMCSRAIDLVGRRSDRSLVVVELKRGLTASVIHQAMVADLITFERYAAIGTRPSAKGVERCRKLGVGILSVISGSVSVLLEPQPPLSASGVRLELCGNSDAFRQQYQERIHASLDVQTPNGIGGRPNMKGEGPAQDCYERVAQWRTANPKATWRDIYANVTNHYESAKSMYSAMRMVEERRFRAERKANEARLRLSEE